MSIQLKAWLTLWLVPGLGPKKIFNLCESLGGPDAVLAANASELEALGLPYKWAEEIKQMEPLAEAELAKAQSLGLSLIDWDDPFYPEDLRQLLDAPPVLYQAGEHDFNQGLHLAFVGSRKASYPGKAYAMRLVERLAVLRPDTVIVSGLALGIDGAAHEAALACGLKTVAVLAGGLSDIYPNVHRALAHKVAAQGCLLTEFPCPSKPLKEHFPLRNRIISGISKGVLVVEAGERSGASITANLALEQGREVFALPGPPDSPFCRGSNRLIQQGRAKLVMDAEDLLEELVPGWREANQAKVNLASQSEKPPLGAQEAAIFDALEMGPLHSDQLALKTGMPVYELLAHLTSMEMKGLIFNRAGNLVERA